MLHRTVSKPVQHVSEHDTRKTTTSDLNQYQKSRSLVYLEWDSKYGEDDPQCPGILGFNKSCKEMNEMRFIFNDAIGLIPAHPRCHCCWTPITKTMLMMEKKLSGKKKGSH